MSTGKPWTGSIPPEDLMTFEGGEAADARPMSAGTSPALIIVDMTVAFVDSAYPTGHSPTGWPCVDANVELLAHARSLGVPVYFTKNFPDAGYVPAPHELGRWKAQGVPKVPGALPPGDLIVDALTPRDDETVIHKHSRPSAFFGTPLASYLTYQRIDTVIVTGMTTSGCVRATALDAFQNNFNVVIPYECAADRSQISHRVSLFDLHMKYADVVSLSETMSYLTGCSKGNR